MTGWLLDTNVPSELRRPKPGRDVVAFVAARPLEALHVSSFTLAEIRFGIEQVSRPTQRADLQAWFATVVRSMFVDRILPISEDVMLRWRSLVEEGRRMRHTFSQPDPFIAATALHDGMTVVSRDAGGFARTGFDPIDPWRPASP